MRIVGGAKEDELLAEICAIAGIDPKVFDPQEEAVRRPTGRNVRALKHDLASDVVVLEAGDALDTLRLVRRCKLKAGLVLLDPPYAPEEGQSVQAHRAWLARLVRAAARLAHHVIVWGDPTNLGALVERCPRTHALRGWITWAIANGVTRAKGWRPGHQMAIHLAHTHAKMHAENFYSDAQSALASKGRLRFQPTPPTVLHAPLIAPSLRRHVHEKPKQILEPLVLMSTERHQLIVDPMCGSGVIAEVARDLGRRVVLSDLDTETVAKAVAGFGRSRGRYHSVNRSKSAPVEQDPLSLEARRIRAVKMCAEGRAQSDVARAVGVSRQAVSTWVRAAARDANSALRARPRRGRARFLDHDQQAALAQLLRQTPTGWTGPKFAEAIEKRFGIAYHPDAARRILRRLLRELKR